MNKQLTLIRTRERVEEIKKGWEEEEITGLRSKAKQ